MPNQACACAQKQPTAPKPNPQPYTFPLLLLQDPYPSFSFFFFLSAPLSPWRRLQRHLSSLLRQLLISRISQSCSLRLLSTLIHLRLLPLRLLHSRLLLRLLGSGLLLGLLHLVTAEALAPLESLLGLDVAEEVGGLPDLVAGLDGVRGPGVGDEDGFGLKLVEDRGGGVGHEGGEDRGKEVDQVEGEADDGTALGRFVLGEFVVELVGLEEGVAGLRDEENGGQAGLDLYSVHLFEVLREELVDLGLELVNGGILVLGVVGHDVVVVLSVDEFHNAANKVAKVLQKQVVVAADKVIPIEFTVSRLRSVGEKVVTEHIRTHAGLLGRVTKHTDATGLGELAAFVREVFGRRKMVKLGPVVSGANLTSGEDDRMEDNVILAEELVELDVGVVPPLLPLVSVAGSNGDVANASVEPGVDNLLFVARERDWGSPLHVSRNASTIQTLLQPSRRDLLGVGGPSSLDRGLLEKSLDLRLELIKLEENVVRILGDGSRALDLAARLLQVERVQELSTSVTLVTTGITISALGTFALNESIGKESMVVLTVELGSIALLEEAVLLELEEDFLGDDSLGFGSRSSKYIEADFEPLVNVGVDLVVLVA